MTYEALWKRLTPLYEAGEAKAIVRWVLDVRFGLTMADILCGKVEELSEAAQAELEAMTARLAEGEPVQYVAGKADYVSLDSYRYEDPQPIPASTGIRTMQDDVPGYTIRGTLKTIGNAEAADLGAYILQSNGKWQPVSTANQKALILPFRAYLLPSAHSNGARALRTALKNANGATAIDTIETIDADGTERYYDLQGRRINPNTAKGVVIENGKKTIKR